MTTQTNPQHISVAHQQNYGGSQFPLVYGAQACPEDLGDWIRQNKDTIEAELALHGAILFRGFGVNDDQDFDAFIRAFDWPNFTYAESLSNAVRRNRTELVFTANEAPSTVSIFLHHEMAQTPVHPSKLFFFCEQAAESGGATPICRSDILLQKLTEQAPAFVAACEAKGVRYSQTMPEQDDMASGQGRSWRSTLSAQTRADAEQKLDSLGYSWDWQQDDSVRVTSPQLSAVRELADGRKVFFNQLIAAFRGWKDGHNTASKSICFGDGSVIDSSDMAVAIDLADALTFDIPWHSGDVALIDNYLTMHGRKPFKGQRKVLASLVG